MGRLAVFAFAGLALASAAGAGASGSLAPTCAGGFTATAPRGLPAPVVLQTACARFTVQPDGGVSVGPLPLRDTSPSGAVDYLGDGAWLVARRHRLLVIRDGKTLWQSWRRFPRARESWGLLGPSSLFFVNYSTRTLYVARLGGREWPVGHGEEPVGWSSRGELYTYRARRLALRLRTASGRLIGRIARPVPDFRLEPDTKTLLYVTEARRLFRADGYRRHELRDLAALGFSARGRWIEPLDAGMIAVYGKQRTAVLKHDGSVFRMFEFRANWVLPAEDGHALAMVAGDSIYVLASGAERPRRVYQSLLPLEGCDAGVELAWRQDWLLLHAYRDGAVMALDTTGPARVDLTAFASKVPGKEDQEGDTYLFVGWADEAGRPNGGSASALMSPASRSTAVLSS